MTRNRVLAVGAVTIAFIALVVLALSGAWGGGGVPDASPTAGASGTAGSSDGSVPSSGTTGTSGSTSSPGHGKGAVSTAGANVHGCADLPRHGGSSVAAMATARTAVVLEHNPITSVFADAIKKSGLDDTLNGTVPLTVFVPTNAAFAALPTAQRKALFRDSTALTLMVTDHLLAGRFGPASIVGPHRSLAGSAVTVTGGGTKLVVNGTKVLCGNIGTRNAVVYLVGSLLSVR